MHRVFSIALVLLFAATGSSIAADQNSTSTLSPSLPAGISVVATGTYRDPNPVATLTIAINDKAADKLSMTERLAHAEDATAKLKSAFGENAISNAQPNFLGEGIVTALVRVSLKELPSASSKLRTISGNVTQFSIVPSDAESAKNHALANALVIARARAEAIAVADNRHVGRLLNVSPTPLDLIGSLAALNPLASLNQWSSDVSETAIFTFELLP